MKPKDTTTSYTVIVIGASGRIGREVARLAVAYGASVLAVTRGGTPPNDEPWTHGVEWLARDAREPGALDGLEARALVVAADVAVPQSWFDRFDRVVVVRPEGTVSASDGPESLILATPPEVDDAPIDGDYVFDETRIRVETLGMALLRAAIDDAIAATLGPEELAYLGDAVMLQGVRTPNP